VPRDSDRVSFECDGREVEVTPATGESLLSVLREHLGIMSVKDGCAPQGQCGCCTVLVDGDPRVACVTPVERIAGRSITTVDGLDPDRRDALAEAFLAAGGSQCGFCTPGIVVRAAALLEKGRTTSLDTDRALAAHLCRCTGWCTVEDAIALAAAGSPSGSTRDRARAEERAALEGGVEQRVTMDVPLGAGGFADDTAPRDALVAVPCASSSAVETVDAAGIAWVVADSVHGARAAAGKIQGRRTTETPRVPFPVPVVPPGGVGLATGWVEPAYLEPDASWCEPGGNPASTLANGGAFGGKAQSVAPRAARELADHFDRPVRTLFSREDVVRLGPKRPPIAGSAVVVGDEIRIVGTVLGDCEPFTRPVAWGSDLREAASWTQGTAPGPTTSGALRAVGLAERAVLIEGAIAEAAIDRASIVSDDRAASVLLDTCAPSSGGAFAGARVVIDPASGQVERVEVRVAAGDPLDEVVLRSYCVGAAHMALGWVLTEGLSVDAFTGEVLDLTIRSFGVLRAKDTPLISVTVVDDAGPPRARASDAVFAAVAAATWNAITVAEGARPETFPGLGTRAARQLRR
jgi:aerobic-type carbon monoxide dehydrogenase small subunit (CoxS/CutS family)